MRTECSCDIVITPRGDGTWTATCSVCGDTYETRTSDPLKHWGICKIKCPQSSLPAPASRTGQRIKKGRTGRKRRQRNGEETESRKAARQLRYPCAYRGLEILGQVECTLCGLRGQLMDVHPCALFGQCTEWRWTSHSREPSHACEKCPSRVGPEPAPDAPPDASLPSGDRGDDVQGDRDEQRHEPK